MWAGADKGGGMEGARAWGCKGAEGVDKGEEGKGKGTEGIDKDKGV